MHAYRTHNCAALTAANVGQDVRLSGWVHRKRDHGGVLFVDLRDHYGLTQIVCRANSEALAVLEHLRAESVVTIDGEVVSRGPEATNPNLATGAIDLPGFWTRRARRLLRTSLDQSADMALVMGIVSRVRGDNAPQLGAAFLALARGDSTTAAQKFVEAAGQHPEAAGYTPGAIL